MSEELEVIEAPLVNALASLEHAIRALPDDAPIDSVLQLREELLFYGGESKRMLNLIEDRMIAHIKEKGAIEYGNGVRFYLSHPKTTKCVDLKGTIDALGAATGGDETLFLGCFSSNAIKYGAAKKLLATEDYARLFTVTVKDKLENDEPAPLELTKADLKWVR